VNFKYFSLAYLNQWLSKDRRYCDALSSGTTEKQLAALSSAAGFYRIARNLPKKYDKGPRYAVVLDALCSIPETPVSTTEIIPIIHRTRQTISREYGNKGVLSLTTKFMWLRMKHPVIIYDSQARRALGTKDGDLDAFYASWRQRFEDRRAEIAKACSTLPDVVDYCVDPSAGRDYVAQITHQQWFQERVLDVQLWASQART
jgi:hypothetical protein